jgi:beta-glucuronidase
VHEDSQSQGFAVDNAFRERLVAETKAAGATLMRSHYPMHPYTHELADRNGVLIWSEIPVYQISAQNLAKQRVTTLAEKELEKNIVANQNHPSVLLWSIANELSARPGSSQTKYIRDAVRQAKALDPSRPVALAVAGYLTVGCQQAYRPLDVIGINDYFGWYPGPQGSIFDRARLSGFLDQVRACYPRHAVMVTEFGAEANRDGPAEEKGTFAFQQDFVNFHLGVYNQKSWLSGAVYWALTEFKVRPGWDGGNPRPSPPLHQKGLLRYGDLARKPAWSDLRRNYTATRQFG